MKKKQKLLVVAAVAAVLMIALVAGIVFHNSRPTPVGPTLPTVKVETKKITPKFTNFDVIDKIAEAKDLLEDQEAGFQVCTKTTKKVVATKSKKDKHGKKMVAKKTGKKRVLRTYTAKSLCSFNTLLAVVNEETGTIEKITID